MKIRNRSEELFFTLIHNSEEDNEYRILLNAVIISLLLLPKNQKIKFHINKNVEILINRFLINMSERQKLDNEYYLELTFIGNFIKENDIISLHKTNIDVYDDEFLKMTIIENILQCHKNLSK